MTVNPNLVTVVEDNEDADYIAVYVDGKKFSTPPYDYLTEELAKLFGFSILSASLFDEGGELNPPEDLSELIK